MTDKERYATIGTWVEVFREEGVAMSDHLIRDLVKEAGIIGETARNQVGHVVRSGFFAESIIRTLLSRRLEGMPSTDERGLLEIDNETYGTTESLARVLGVSSPTIRTKIREGSLKPISGRVIGGGVFSFYSLAEVKKLCTNLFQGVGATDQNGFLNVNGECFGTINALTEYFGISERAVRWGIRNAKLKPVKARNRIGRVSNCYSVSAVRRGCARFFQELPQADENGMLIQGGELYCTTERLAEPLGLSQPTISARIKQSELQPIRGKSRIGGIFDFYAVSAVRRLCADLCVNLPRADESGTFQKEGEIYGTINVISALLGISQRAVCSTIRKNYLSPIQGKDRMGRIFDYYPASQVRALCDNAIIKRKLDDSR